jgi:lysophospholipase L1-like esterase
MGLPLANQAVLRKKGSALRIVCLGGSTTAGYPYNTAPAFGSGASFPNYLRLILQYNHPDMPDIQMLNMGCNALNSLNIRQLVASLKRNKPDIFILYSGHNEYFGPNEFTITKRKL